MSPRSTRSPEKALLDLPLVGPADVVRVEQAVASLLNTRFDLLLVQAEAVVALEATARSIARPGLRALNVVSGPYGALFGRWLAAAGAEMVTLPIPCDRAISAGDLEKAMATRRFDLVAVVHAEAATGGANPMDGIAEITAHHGALLIVDAVASVGAHQVTPAAWNADVVVIGAQKALAGPAGVSAMSVSPAAWQAMDENPRAPRESILSLLDLRDGWLRTGRNALLGTPSSLETAALDQAIARVKAEGLDKVIRRHRASAAATRAGVRELGLRPWIDDDDAAATVVTTIAAPAGSTVEAIVAAARAAGSQILGAAPGSLAAGTLRVNHTGLAARLDVVCNELAALGIALGRQSAAAVDAAQDAWLSVR